MTFTSFERCPSASVSPTWFGRYDFGLNFAVNTV
jgi:hypothetical protein